MFNFSKHIIQLLLIALVSGISALTMQAQTMPCAGIAVSGDYSYEVYTAGGMVHFKFHPLAPIAGSASAIIYVKEGIGAGTYPGFNMVAAAGDFTYTKTAANGTILGFYFSYKVPAGGERNSSADPHAYLAGATCAAGAPNLTITAPVEAASFTAPANLTIAATALDINGTVSKVAFYRGTTLLGEDSTAPYSYSWANAPAGNYALTAKATDNSGLETISVPVNIIVNAPNMNGYCGTAFSGDYEYKAVTNSGSVFFTMHPLSSVVGSEYAFIYLREGVSGAYAGYEMIASGGDFVFSKAIANNTPISIYFTYQVPTGGERNSSANPHSYVVGSVCNNAAGASPTVNITAPANNASFLEPATVTFSANAADTDGTVSKVAFYNGKTLLGTDNSSPYSVDWNNAPAGNYNITAKATDNSTFTTISSVVKVVVNINFATGFCGTVANGDYSYKVEAINGKAVFSMRPLTPIAGCAYALIYVREGLTGVYPGYQMTKIGSDFRYSKTIANNTPLSIYFTYQVPTGGERNSSLTPHSYVMGANCLGAVSAETLDASTAGFTIYPNPAENNLWVQMDDSAATAAEIRIINAWGATMLLQQKPSLAQPIDIRNLAAGMYVVKMTDAQTQKVTAQKLIVL